MSDAIREFYRRTPALTASEQLELLGLVIDGLEAASPGRPTTSAPSRAPAGTRPANRLPPGRNNQGGSGRTDFASVARGFQQALDIAQTAFGVAGGLAQTFGGNDRTAQDIARWSNLLAQGAGQVRAWQGPQSGQPSGPASTQGAAPGVAGAGIAGTGSQQSWMPSMPQPAAPLGGLSARYGTTAAAPDGPQLNATAMMALLLNNPQLIQAMQSALVPQGGAPSVPVSLPNSQPGSIPLGNVMNALAQLAQVSTRELDALANEDDAEVPDYLLREDGSFVVDPASAQERAALVLQLLRMEAEGRRLTSMDGDVVDQSDAWARDAGFDSPAAANPRGDAPFGTSWPSRQTNSLILAGDNRRRRFA